jgi:thioesterase domain-containing protein
VVNHSEISYLKPITKDFDAIALRPEQANWEKFERMIDRKGKGRIEMDSVIYEDGMLAVAYKGAFVVSERGIVVPT